MRVVLATRLYAPEPAAASFRLSALVRELVSRGHDVEVVTTRFEGPRSERRDGALVRRWPVARSHDGAVRGYLSYLSFDAPLLLRLLSARRPSVIVVEPPPTSGIVSIVVGALRRIPVVWYAADVWSDAAVIAGAPAPVVALLRRLEVTVLRRSAGVLAVSAEVAARVEELSGRRASVVGNGVDTAVFHQEPGEDASGERPVADSPVLVYAGTSSEFQGAGIFIEAMALLRRDHPDARLTILGGGQDARRLAEQARELPEGAVSVLPRTSPEEAARLLRGATASLASIVPGVGYDFAIPTKIFASSACGTPVVFAGPDAAAARTVRSAPLGWACPFEPEAIARSLREAIDAAAQPGHRGRRGELAEWAERTGSLSGVARRAADVVEGAVGIPVDRGAA